MSVQDMQVCLPLSGGRTTYTVVETMHPDTKITPYTKAIGLSFLVHLALVLFMIGTENPAVRKHKPLVIDFRLDAPSTSPISATAKQHRALQAVSPVRRENTPPVQPFRQEREPQEEQLQAPPTTEPQTVGPPAAAVPAASITGGKARAGDTGTGGTAFAPHGGTEKGVGVSGQARTGTGTGNEKARYLKEHYAYIKELVQKKAVYPAMARRMGWEGRVVVAFTIQSDGVARDLDITESSGTELLNRSALDAVRKASPFPKPPAEAQIKLPIVYKLD